MSPPLQSNDHMFEILKIVNEVGTTWKVKRALLRTEPFHLSEDVIRKLVPEDAPGDY